MPNIEEKKLKRKMDDAPTVESADPKPSEALRTSDNSTVDESTPRPFKSMRTSDEYDSLVKSSEPSNDRELKENIPQDHSCPYCDRKFSSPQALGGHQNAHKHERLLEKEKNKYMYGDEFGSCYPRHAYSYLTNYYQGSSLNLYHGAQLQHPMVQIPSISSPRLSSIAYGHHQGLHLPSTSFNGHPLGSTSSWSGGGGGGDGGGGGGGAITPMSNFQGLSLFGPINQISLPIINEANEVQGHAGVGNYVEDLRLSLAAPQASPEEPNVSPTTQASQELDLTLRLSFP
ncbi:hypothetical protein Lal_00030392 [Lupinus albus]|uniref:Putative transcription factor C2H2 family n=1 Tax=Lupinus albus TaxID=3870 RepID=A0A6A4N9H3_LUPAL|nr:putative transcription factor C2H2 family [Lupinus albus]KAF1883285.1 hypothetical protein Lal_00030392 [Lupinus albus]